LFRFVLFREFVGLRFVLRLLQFLLVRFLVIVGILVVFGLFRFVVRIFVLLFVVAGV
jgi:hypothetical protein